MISGGGGGGDEERTETVVPTESPATVDDASAVQRAMESPEDVEALRNLTVGQYAATRADPVVYEALSSTWCNSILWFFLDISDSWWVTAYTAVGFSAYGMLLAVTSGWEYSNAVTVVMGVNSLASIILAIASIFIGALSDTIGKRKSLVIIFAALVLVCLILLPMVHSLVWAGSCFLVSQVFIALARLLYDSQVPFVIEPKKRALVQATGAAVGVFGSIAAIVWSITSKAIWGPWTVITEETYHHFTSTSGSSLGISFGAMKAFLIGGAVMYFAFTFPYLFHKEKQSPRTQTFAVGARRALGDMKKTFFDIIRDRNGLCCTIGWLVILDSFFSWQSVSAVALSAAIGFSAKDFDLVIGIALPVAFCTSIIGGYIIGRWGTKRGTIIAIAAFLTTESLLMVVQFPFKWGKLPKWVAFIGVVFNGVGTGFITCTPRLLFVHLAEPSRVAQWFGLQRFFTKAVSFFTPLVYSAIVKAGLSHGFPLNVAWRFVFLYRFIVLTIALFVIIFGMVDPYRRYLAGERAPYRHIYEPGGALPSDKLIPNNGDIFPETQSPVTLEGSSEGEVGSTKIQ